MWKKDFFYNKLPDEKKLSEIFKSFRKNYMVQVCFYFVAEKIELEMFLRQNYHRVGGVIDLTEENLFGEENCDSLKANQICITSVVNGMLKEMGKLSNFQKFWAKLFRLL